MDFRFSKAGDVGGRVSIFSSKFRTPRLPPLEELTLLKVWALSLELMDFEAELSANYGSSLLLFDLFSQKRAEKEGQDLVASLRKEVALDLSASGSDSAKNVFRRIRSRTKPPVSGETSHGQRDEFRTSFWESIKDDHPDECMSRFLVQQDWDVSRSFGSMVAAIRWRVRGVDVEHLLRTGEEGFHATINEPSADESERRVAHGFLAQCEMGKTFVRGIDWEGRPVVISRMRLHQPSLQPHESMKRYMLWQTESIRLMLGPSIKNGLQLWDFSGATTENIQLGTIKFGLNLYQKYFPGALGFIIIHNPPKFFEGSWNIIRGWLNPKNANKVRFTRTVEDLEQYIPRQNILKDLGGDDPWEFEYVPHKPGENAIMNNTELKAPLLQERDVIWNTFEGLTLAMIRLARSGEDYSGVKRKRNEYTDHLRASYWKLDPFLRARSYYDRIGAIGFRRDSALLSEKLTYGEQIESLLGRLDEMSGVGFSSDARDGSRNDDDDDDNDDTGSEKQDEEQIPE